jgi:hypothetical protein
MVSFLPIEGRLSCRLICHELEFRVRFRPDLALSLRFASRQQRNRQSLSAVRDVPARLIYADVIAAVTATKARSPTLVGIIWKSALYRLCRHRHNLYSITTNQAAIIALFRVGNRYVGNLPPMPGVLPDYPAPVVRNAGAERELAMMRWGMPPPPKFGGPPCHQYPEHLVAALARLAEVGKPVLGAGEQLLRIRARAEPGDQEKGRGLVRA